MRSKIAAPFRSNLAKRPLLADKPIFDDKGLEATPNGRPHNSRGTSRASARIEARARVPPVDLC